MPPQPEGNPAPDCAAKDQRTLRVRRNLHRGKGWQARFQVLGELYSRYFSDRQFGSCEAALQAAVDFAARDLRLHRELLALHRRLAPRATSRSGVPGVSRYAATAGRGAHWLAYLDDPQTGRRRSRRFAIGIYGEAGARLLAMEWRAREVAAQRDRYLRLLAQIGERHALGQSQITSL